MCDYNCVKTLIIIIIISLIRTNAALTITYMTEHTIIQKKIQKDG